MDSKTRDRAIGGEVEIEKKRKMYDSDDELDTGEEPPMEAEIVDKTFGYKPQPWEIYASAALIIVGLCLAYVFILSAIQGYKDWQPAEIPTRKSA